MSLALRSLPIAALIVGTLFTNALLAQPETPATEATPASESEFIKQLPEWKKLVGKLRELQVRYKVAKPADRPPLEKEYNDLVTQGEAMIPALVSGAIQDYQADPKQDGEAARFLISRVDADVKADRYPEAYEISKLLVEKGFPNPVIYDYAGTAAFAMNDYDAAEKYFTLAKEKDALGEEGIAYLGEIPKYKELWKKEQELREAESKADDLPRVEFKTDKGTIVIELFENEAPNTVANFVSLVEKGFYNNLTFHRVIHGFMAQGGDPKGDGTGGPGYTIACEVDKPNARSHFTGTLSMAHAGRDTGGSQFFLTFRPTPHLNKQHTVFGRIIEGMDVLTKLKNSENNPNPPGKILEAKVLRKREHEYKPVTAAGK